MTMEVLRHVHYCVCDAVATCRRYTYGRMSCLFFPTVRSCSRGPRKEHGAVIGPRASPPLLVRVAPLARLVSVTGPI